MQLCGGRTLTTGVRVVVVYWSADTIYRGTPAPGTYGPGINDTSVVGYFLRHLGGSPWWNIESTYGVANVLTYDAYWANNVNVTAGSLTGAFVSEAQIVAMLQSGVAAHTIPTGTDVIYVVMTGPNVTSISNFPTTCGDHNASGGLVYAVQPYSTHTYCEMFTGVAPYLSPNADAADDIMLSMAHEIAEAATDPVPNTGWMWAGQTGRENADRCGRDIGTTYTTANGGMANVRLGTRDFLIQRNWVNSGTGVCALGWP